MKVRYTRQARDDLADILAYLDERSPTGALATKRAIKAAVELVGRCPDIGQPAGEGTTRVVPIGRTAYLLQRAIRRDSVAIVHVRHAARKRS